MKKFYTAFLILTLALTSCVNQKSVLKWIKTHPDKVNTQEKTEYVIKKDTVTLYSKPDTITEYITGTDIDTMYNEGNAELTVKIKYDTIIKTNKIYLRALCKTDTVTLVKNDTISIYKTQMLNVEQLSWWAKNKILIIFSILVFILVLLSQYIYRKTNLKITRTI